MNKLGEILYKKSKDKKKRIKNTVFSKFYYE